jgi:ComF family protein
VDHSGLLFRQAVAACRYDGVAAELVKGLKFRRDVRALDVMVPLLARRLAEAGVAERVDAVAPVPLHWLRRAGRRFNQAELIAEPLAETLRLRYERRALRRTRYTVPQVRLSPAERRVNLRGAFAVRDPAAVRDARVLLVDDVMTTCSTARECAQALREAGAQAVYVAVFARAQSFSQPPEVSTA